MKTCPVCKMQLFDDMEVCYGCMYAFGSKPELEQRAQEQQAQQAQQAQPQAQGLQSISPMAGWIVRLEMRDTADPARSWSMELAPSQESSQVMATMMPQPLATNAPCAAAL